MATTTRRGRTQTLPRSPPADSSIRPRPSSRSSSLFFRVSDDAAPDAVDRRSSLLLPPSESMSPRALSLEQHHQLASVREDETLRMLAREGMAHLQAVVNVGALAGKWRSNGSSRGPPETIAISPSSGGRGGGVGSGSSAPAVDSRVTTESFGASSSCALPCSVNEITHAVSDDHMDHWNAAMVELYGSEFGYGVKVRDVAIPESNAEVSGSAKTIESLSLKIAHFRGAIPVLSGGQTVIFLDFVRRERGGALAMRVVRSLREDRESGELSAGGTIAGYYLQEDRLREHTTMFVHAAHRSTGSRPRHEDTAQRLYKLASSLAVTTCELVLRRRLGAARERMPVAGGGVGSSSIFSQLSLDASTISATRSTRGRGITSGSGSDKGDACSVCGAAFGALQLKKRHECALCGRSVCGSCAAARDVEERIGLVFRARVCVGCVGTQRRRAFAASANSNTSDPAVA